VAECVALAPALHAIPRLRKAIRTPQWENFIRADEKPEPAVARNSWDFAENTNPRMNGIVTLPQRNSSSTRNFKQQG
jgi:hypothetical protein